MGRAPCCDKANVKKGPWSPEEDAKLKTYIQDQGTGGNWISLPQKIGLKRCGKSCRLRWLNYLRPNIKHGGFSEKEDNIICTLFLSIGSRWSIIAAQLPGRTDNDIKNYWNTKLKKKLIGKQHREGQMGRRENNPTQPNHMVSEYMVNPQPYHPELQHHMPLLDYSLDNHIVDQDSIMNYLVMGGKFCHDPQQPNINSTNNTNLEYPFQYLSPYQDLVYDNSINSVSSTSSANPDCSQLANMYQEFNYQTYEQLESSFGVDIVACRSGNSSVESPNWGDINSMVYDPIMGLKDSIFQEPSCFGIQ